MMRTDRAHGPAWGAFFASFAIALTFGLLALWGLR